MKNCLHRSLGLIAGIVIATAAAVPAQAAAAPVNTLAGSSPAVSQPVASVLTGSPGISKTSLDPRARG